MDYLESLRWHTLLHPPPPCELGNEGFQPTTPQACRKRQLNKCSTMRKIIEVTPSGKATGDYHECPVPGECHFGAWLAKSPDGHGVVRLGVEFHRSRDGLAFVVLLK